MGQNSSHFKKAGSRAPVECVSWDDVQAFCKQVEGTVGLPSEAQWEYACRAGTNSPYYWGASMDGAYCWYRDNSGSKTHRVGASLPNAWALHDMLGNVWEWCHDCFRLIIMPQVPQNIRVILVWAPARSVVAVAGTAPRLAAVARTASGWHRVVATITSAGVPQVFCKN